MRTRWLATIALLLLPAAGGAEQLDYGVKTQGGWSQNVYGTPDNAETVSQGQEVDIDPIADYSARISPWGRVSDNDGDLTWSLRYQPSYEYYLAEGDLNGFDHDASAMVAWRAGERTTLIFSESFRKYRSITRFNESAPGEEAVLRGRSDDLTGNATSLSIRRLLSPRDEVLLSTVYTLQEYGTNVSSEVDTWTTSARYDHTWSERTSVGASGTWTRQRFTRTIGDDAITDYYNISATLEHSFSRTLRFELSVGPTLIDSDTALVTFQPQYLVGSRPFAVPGGGTVNLGGLQAIDATNCEDGVVSISDVRRFRACLPSTPRPALTDDQLATLGYSPQGQLTQFTEFDALLERDSNGSLVALDDSGFGNLELTYFARAALIKEWERWHAELSYERSADESGSFGATSVRDGVELALSWEPARLWSVGLIGGVVLLDQASEGVIPSEVVVANEDVGFGPVASVQQVVVTLDDDALSYQSLYASLTASRQLTERAKAFATLYWYDQDQKFDPGGADTGGTSTTSNLTVWVGVEWQFETLKF